MKINLTKKVIRKSRKIWDLQTNFSCRLKKVQAQSTRPPTIRVKGGEGKNPDFVVEIVVIVLVVELVVVSAFTIIVVVVKVVAVVVVVLGVGSSICLIAVSSV